MPNPIKNFKLEGLDLKKYESDGVDIGLIISNIKRTPTERLLMNYEFMKLIQQIQKQKNLDSYDS